MRCNVIIQGHNTIPFTYDETTKVINLRAVIALRMGVDSSSLNLIYKGALLSNNEATLVSCGLPSSEDEEPPSVYGVITIRRPGSPLGTQSGREQSTTNSFNSDRGGSASGSGPIPSHGFGPSLSDPLRSIPGLVPQMMGGPMGNAGSVTAFSLNGSEFGSVLSGLINSVMGIPGGPLMVSSSNGSASANGRAPSGTARIRITGSGPRIFNSTRIPQTAFQQQSISEVNQDRGNGATPGSTESNPSNTSGVRLNANDSHTSEGTRTGTQRQEMTERERSNGVSTDTTVQRTLTQGMTQNTDGQRGRAQISVRVNTNRGGAGVSNVIRLTDQMSGQNAATTTSGVNSTSASVTHTNDRDEMMSTTANDSNQRNNNDVARDLFGRNRDGVRSNPIASQRNHSELLRRMSERGLLEESESHSTPGPGSRYPGDGRAGTDCSPSCVEVSDSDRGSVVIGRSNFIPLSGPIDTEDSMQDSSPRDDICQMKGIRTARQIHSFIRKLDLMKLECQKLLELYPGRMSRTRREHIETSCVRSSRLLKTADKLRGFGKVLKIFTGFINKHFRNELAIASRLSQVSADVDHNRNNEDEMFLIGDSSEPATGTNRRPHEIIAVYGTTVGVDDTENDESVLSGEATPVALQIQQTTQDAQQSQGMIPILEEAGVADLARSSVEQNTQHSEGMTTHSNVPTASACENQNPPNLCSSDTVAHVEVSEEGLEATEGTDESLSCVSDTDEGEASTDEDGVEEAEEEGFGDNIDDID